MSSFHATVHTSRWPTIGFPLFVLRMCWAEARPSVLLIFLMRFHAGIALSAAAVGRGFPGRTVVCALTWMLAIFSIYVFNGVMDVQEDRINGSRRPIASGALSPDAAARIALCAAVLSIAMAIEFGLPTAWTMPVLVMLGYLYSGPPWFLKRRPVAAALTGGLGGLLTYHAGFTAYAGTGWAQSGPALPIFAVGMSLWMGLVGGLTKDLADVEGDAAAGRRTMAVMCRASTVRFAASAAALGLAAVFFVVAFHYAPPLMLPAVVMLMGAGAVTLVSLGRPSDGCRSERRRPYKAFMATQFAVHLSLVA
jgi:4-hydroxybenzoate polyprenyltransferase